MAKIKAKERGFVNPLRLPTLRRVRSDEVPHWKVWAFALRNPGVPWWRAR